MSNAKLAECLHFPGLGVRDSLPGEFDEPLGVAALGVGVGALPLGGVLPSLALDESKPLGGVLPPLALDGS